MAIAARVPLLSLALGALPVSLRFLALPLAAAWALSRWEIDGRPPHRAVIGLVAWRLRPRSVAALRRVPRNGSRFAPLGRLVAAPDLAGPSYPPGSLEGPTRLLFRYPASVSVGRGWLGRRADFRSAKTWHVRARGSVALHAGRTLEVPQGRTVRFEREK